MWCSPFLKSKLLSRNHFFKHQFNIDYLPPYTIRFWDEIQDKSIADRYIFESFALYETANKDVVLL